MDVIIDTNKYLEFKNVLSGCKSLLDAMRFLDYYIRKYPEMKDIIKSMVDGKKYYPAFDIYTMLNVMNYVNNNIEYREDALEYIKTIEKQIDDVQLATFMRIISKKKVYIRRNLQTKKCPHCGRETTLPSNTEYVVCGFTNSKEGYDKIGCMSDWCFKCGKMLCKKWGDDQLFVISNRIHNGECCRHHAEIHNKKYPDDYCVCSYSHEQIKQHDNIIEEIDKDIDLI